MKPIISDVSCQVRRRTRKRSTGDVREETLNMKVHICSENNFPTAAGLASSAAGYACLGKYTYCLGILKTTLLIVLFSLVVQGVHRWPSGEGSQTLLCGIVYLSQDGFHL